MGTETGDSPTRSKMHQDSSSNSLDPTSELYLSPSDNPSTILTSRILDPFLLVTYSSRNRLNRKREDRVHRWNPPEAPIYLTSCQAVESL